MGDLTEITPINLLIFVNLLQFAWNIISSSSKDLKDNTHAIIKLEAEMKSMGEKLSRIQQMEDDINELSFRLNELHIKKSMA